jgi:hypothetical protein
VYNWEDSMLNRNQKKGYYTMAKSTNPGPKPGGDKTNPQPATRPGKDNTPPPRSLPKPGR